MTKQKIIDILVSLLIGAAIAGVTVFLEGLLGVLHGLENNTAGGLSGAVYYIFKQGIF